LHADRAGRTPFVEHRPVGFVDRAVGTEHKESIE
jgi:hypothetical protein